MKNNEMKRKTNHATEREPKISSILFNTDMVQAILDGRKTVTRQLIKEQHLKVLNSQYHKKHPEVSDKTLIEKLCETPHRPRDVLYVRETWQYIDFAGDDNGYVYKVSENGKLWENETEGWKWRPSIHMPKEAARIWLKVTDVRAERLQDIDNEQILKEGVNQNTIERYKKQMPEETEDWIYIVHRIAFKRLWDSTIKKSYINRYGWYANPWVWVIEFERCEKPEE